jgi:hypothetical protein
MADIQRIPFHDDELYAVVDERTGKRYVLPKPMVELFGLRWQAQFAKLTKNQIFAKGITKIMIPTAGGEQEAILLEQRLVHAWLLSIDSKRVAEAYREKLLRYQEECADVLDAYFTKGIALNPRLPDAPERFSIERVREYRLCLEELGLFETRDRLMFADAVRTQFQREMGLLPASDQLAPPQGFDIADAIQAVAPTLPPQQRRKQTPMLGKLVAAEHRRRFPGIVRTTVTRFVDGKARPVNWYLSDESSWVYPIIQSYLASQGLLGTPTTLT